MRIPSIAAVLSALTLFAFMGDANAATFLFSFTSGSGDSGSGQFTTTPSGLDSLVIAATGTIDGDAISNLYTVNGFQGNDNLIKSSGPLLTILGISLETALNTKNYNLYYDAAPQFCPLAGYCLFSDSFPAGTGTDHPITFSLTAVPEPAIWAMMLIGFFGVGTMMRRSRSTQTFAAA